MATLARTQTRSRRHPERSRNAILQAAVREFARNGIAGARTDAIARNAHVNKALLYYYFEDKESLYGAALDHIFQQQRDHMLEVLDRDLPPKKKVLTYVGTYFDFIAEHQVNRNLVQVEMMRAGHGSPHMQRIARQYFLPLFKKLGEVIHEGIASGEFRPIKPEQFIPSMVALVVFYFISAPVMKTVMGFDPLSPVHVATRRTAVLDFISSALFHNPRNPKGQHS
ncbi:MAG TPA: TetR/AcrR family transcriptional regulator [Terriglobales bacterium]